MKTIDTQYEDLIAFVRDNGVRKGDRTGTGTISTFAPPQLRYNMKNGFPLITSKKTHAKSIIHELLWFISGDTNLKYLQDNGVTIWDEWQASRPYNVKKRKVTLVERRSAVASVPFTGARTAVHKYEKGTEDYKLASIWEKMIKRCYNPASDKYPFYGAKGVTVAPEWHNVETFIEDVKKLPHWMWKQKDWENIHLDKDYYGANQYGPSTTVWLRQDENVTYMSSVKPVIAENPTGGIIEALSQADLSEKVGITKSSLNRFMNKGILDLSETKGANRKFVGWSFYEKEIPAGNLLRLELLDEKDLGPVYGAMWRKLPNPYFYMTDEEAPYKTGEETANIDQLAELIEAIKTNPDSRRLILATYFVPAVPYQALPPCHSWIQFYVSEGKLSMQWYQRSWDLFLGGPFNIASYALLLHMVAQQTGLEAHELIAVAGDAHIYSNHLEQVEELLSRDPKEFPDLVINRKPDSIDDYKFEDFEIVGYDPHPAIKAPVAV